MAAVASIKFDQADGSGSPAGEAHPAIFYFAPDLAKNVVTITNGDNTDVESWKIELLYQPPDSALGAVPGTPVVLASATSPTPTIGFIMDAPDGCYRIQLTVWDGSGVSDVDIRNVGVPNGRGIIIPPYQKLPDPLPLLGTNLPGEKADELNFNGQVYGWLGDSSEGLHHDIIRLRDDLPFVSVVTTPFTAKATQDAPFYLVNLTSLGTDSVFDMPVSGWRIGQRFRVQAYGSTDYKVTLNVPAGHTINGLSSFDFKPPNTAVLVYLGGTEWTLVGAKYDRYERNLVAGVENVQVIGFQSIGSSALLDPADFPNSVFDWRVVIETTDGLDAAEIRLFNVTLGSAVAGTTLSTVNLIPTHLQTLGITLELGPNLYSAQLWLQTTGSPNVATCRQAQILAKWMQP